MRTVRSKRYVGIEKLCVTKAVPCVEVTLYLEGEILKPLGQLYA